MARLIEELLGVPALDIVSASTPGGLSLDSFPVAGSRKKFRISTCLFGATVGGRKLRDVFGVLEGAQPVGGIPTYSR